MGWWSKDPAPDFPACLEIKDVTPKEPTPSEPERAPGNREITMEDNDDASPRTPNTPVNNAFTNSTQTLVNAPTGVDSPSEGDRKSEESAEREDTVAELTPIPTGSRPWLRESKLPPRPRDSTNPYTLPVKNLPCQDDGHDQYAAFDDIPLSGRQGNIYAIHHARHPSADSTDKAANTDDCGAPYPLEDSMSILSPDPYGRVFNKYEHVPTPDKETFSRSPTPPPKVTAAVPMNQHTSSLVDDDYGHRDADTHCSQSDESMRRDTRVYDDTAQATHGTYIPPTYIKIPLQHPQPTYAGASRAYAGDQEMQRGDYPSQKRRQGLWSWKFWKAGWWTVERVLLILIVWMSFLIFVVLLGRK